MSPKGVTSVDRRRFLLLFSAGLLALPRVGHAQPPEKLWRIGYLDEGSADRGGPHLDAFRQGLRELGWVEGRNVVIEYRQADGRLERFPEMAAELARLNMDVIVVGGPQGVKAAKAATPTIPIVMTFVGDPIGQGFIKSFARPGGTITGLSNLAEELDSKRLELLKEVAPRITRIAVLWNPPQPRHAPALKTLERAARSLGVQLQPLAVKVPEDLAGAFAAIRRERAGAVTMLGSGLHVQNFRRIAELALAAKVPTISWHRDFPGAGGLMAYGANELEIVRRSAAYVDRIL
jgi:putative ABC transport system substrate-binding protein